MKSNDSIQLRPVSVSFQLHKVFYLAGICTYAASRALFFQTECALFFMGNLNSARGGGARFESQKQRINVLVSMLVYLFFVCFKII